MTDTTTFSYPKDTPLYSNNIWIITLADLFMVLLVFFIMLNNISAADKAKQKKAVDSINKSFSKTSSYQGDTITLLSFPAIVDNYFNSIEGMMREDQAPQKEKAPRTGSKMEIKIRSNDFFEDGKSVTKGKQRNFFKQLSSIMLQNIQGVKINVAITVDSLAFSEAAKNAYHLDMDRAKILADRLISSGVSAGVITSGIAFGNGDNITMKFEVIKPGGAVVE
jgi:flagellar motor protein MotB